MMALAMASRAPPSFTANRVGVVNMAESKADIEKLAFELNPVVGYWDPLNLVALNLFGKGDLATIGFIRHAEIKHGRIAMFGFIGYMVHENGIRWGWPLQGGVDFSYEKFEGMSAPAVWDATPWEAKLQIILFVGFLEAWSETKYVLENDGQAHYMRGGKPGYFPTFDLGTPPKGSGDLLGWGVAHPVPFDMYDPFKFNKNLSDERKANLLLVEINNGRLAMLGLFGFLSEATIPGSVPALKGLIKGYDGEVMAPFAPEFHIGNL